MSKRKVLFLESKSYYESLGILDNLSSTEYEFHFNGNKHYKISNQEIRQYSYVVSALYHDELSIFMTIKAIENEVTTILLGDGIIEWNNMFEHPFMKKKGYRLYHPILHENFYCVGSFECKYFNFLGVKAHQFLPKRVIPNNQKIPVVTKGSILVTTANTAYFNEKEYKLLINLMKQVLLELANLQLNIQFRIYDKRIIEELDIPEDRNIIVGSFEEVIKDFDVVISTPSSIVLNSMYHDRAVAQLIYRDSPMFLQSGWMITSKDNVNEAIHSMINRDPHRMAFQDFIVHDYIEGTQGVNIFDFKHKNNSVEKPAFMDKALYNLINSKLNFNLLYLGRRIYLRYKNNKLVRFFIKKIKG